MFTLFIVMLVAQATSFENEDVSDEELQAATDELADSFGARKDFEWLIAGDDAVTFIYRDEVTLGEVISYWEHAYYRLPARGTSKLLTRIDLDCDGRYRYTAQDQFDEEGNVIASLNEVGDWIYYRPQDGRKKLAETLCELSND